MMENDNVSEKPSPPIRSGSSNSSPLWFVRRFWVNHEHSFHEGTTEHNSGYSNEASDETSTEVSDEASTEASDEASTEEDTSDHLSLASLEHRSQPTLSTPLPTTIEVDEEYEDSSESNWQPLSTTAEGRKEPISSTRREMEIGDMVAADNRIY
ncbi:uncharacterized protein K452DRAFT_283964 [Aplosporella prunicola CBS 121167]|uniref:Uncharacterized protein n=1 Tax=Aplosporella prunicola CBS 121167 TaxID=1176127 RepID=A0A6A6BNC6_9PEZI|nr:uncharacterized protein K452DRAFT_283964 [Aplosporella prunicola CBS 121167]KAF2145612.1 hypothetical protein K452DRAFT_283964 [Aplosporella prunicola CBS 121167]